MKPSTLTQSQVLKVVKTLVYVGLSAAIGAALSMLQGHPELFGVYAPIANVVLVTLKQVFTKE